MSEAATYPGSRRMRAVRAVPPLPVLVLGLVAGALAVTVTADATAVVVAGVAAGLIAIGVISGGLRAVAALARRRRRLAALEILQGDPRPSILTDADGCVLGTNAAARSADWIDPATTVAAAFDARFADPGARIAVLLTAAAAQGTAEARVEADDRAFRLVCRPIAACDLFLWQAEALPRVGDDALWFDLDGSEITSASDAALAVFGPRVEIARALAQRPHPGAMLRLPRLRGGEEEVLAFIQGSTPDGPARLHLVAGRSIRQGLSAPQADRSVDALPVPVLQLGPEGEVRCANPAASALLQLTPGTRPPPLYELVEGMGRPITEWIADAMRGRGLGKPEIVRADSERGELFLQIVLGRDSAADGLVAVLNDATELKTLEAQFVQSQKMQAIGQLAGGVAHDFNNLLTAISGHCDLLLLSREREDADYADLIQISQNANRAAALVGQLLAFSRKQAQRPVHIDLRETLSDLTHLLNRLVGETIRLDVVHEPGPGVIRADPRQLEQVFMNLVVNARDAMETGGRIRIETRAETLTQPMKRDRAEVPAGDYVVVTLTDEGRGIPPDKLPKIFEPFFTTKRPGEGTGLGLSTVYGIVKQSGGFIFADSRLGAGATFSLYFPAHDPASEPEAEKPAVPPGTGASVPCGQGVVLLVEDEAPVRSFAARALRMRGWTVVEADCAEAALETLSDRTLGVDVFVSDVIMPGLDGPTWVREALKDRPDTRVVFVSGYAEENFPEVQARVPNSTFLPKPFTLTQLSRAVSGELAGVE